MTEPLKPYQLKFEDRTGYLYVLVRSDRMDREIALAYLTEIANECARRNSKSLLLERDVPVMLPTGDLFFVTNAFLEMMKSNRVAIVNPHSKLREDLDLAVTISTNRGANYRLFDSVESAESWLRQ